MFLLSVLWISLWSSIRLLTLIRTDSSVQAFFILDAGPSRTLTSSISHSNRQQCIQTDRQPSHYSRYVLRLFGTTTTTTSSIPIDPKGWPNKFPAKEHCSKCGLCETTFVANVTTACPFLGPCMSRIDAMETEIHGRSRNVEDMVWTTQKNKKLTTSSSSSYYCQDEGRFGVLYEPIRLVKGNRIPDAQWTGVVTGIAIAMLETKQVDAVVCIANTENNDNNDNNNNNWSSPEPIIAKTTQDVLKGRGVKPALAPSLRVLDQIRKDKSIRKLLFCAVGCAVQAFRAVQSDLDLDEVYVLGTNCADNSPTPQAAYNFIQKGIGIDDATTKSSVRGYEFMQDFKVHVKIKNESSEASYITKPYFTLPGTIAESSIAKSCRACFDYTNALADVVVGYMGAPLLTKNARMDKSFQTLTIRNAKGSKMVQTAVEQSKIILDTVAIGKGSHETLASATVSSDALIADIVGKPVPDNGMPSWLGEFMVFGLRQFGPKGINFARYSIDYHIIRNYLHILDVWGTERAAAALPQFSKDIVNYYIENDEQFDNLIQKSNRSTVKNSARSKH